VRITDLLRFARERGEPIFSFEFFPPKTEEGVKALFQTVEALRPLGPAYVCVTYGAGGSTRARTIELVKRLRQDTEVEAMAHLTCVGASRDDLTSVLDELAEAGVHNVMALRGDPPRGQGAFTPHADGFRHASELVAFIRSQPQRWRFCLGAAAYPEGHVETRDLALDLRHTREKVDAGADFLVTQLFFDNAHYFTFSERARAAGITVPIVPGIMPFHNDGRIAQIAARDGIEIPRWVALKMEGYMDDAASIRAFGIEVVTRLCERLIAGGAPSLHFYALNQSALVLDICRRLGRV